MNRILMLKEFIIKIDISTNFYIKSGGSQQKKKENFSGFLTGLIESRAATAAIDGGENDARSAHLVRLFEIWAGNPV